MILISKEKLLRDAFDKVKSEMTDHLEAINENTSEINSNHDYLLKLENMIRYKISKTSNTNHHVNCFGVKSHVNAEINHN